VSAIPPNAIASVLQSGVTQRDAAKDIDTAKQASHETSRRLTGGPDALVELEIEATDADTQVHTDAGGLGSQGRHDAPPDDEESADDADADSQAGVVVDEQGRPHIDLSA
jgi:hypothetical protein